MFRNTVVKAAGRRNTDLMSPLRSNGGKNKNFIPDDIAALMGGQGVQAAEAAANLMESTSRKSRAPKTAQSATEYLINKPEASISTAASKMALVMEEDAMAKKRRQPRAPLMPTPVANLPASMTREMVKDPLVSSDTSTGVLRQRRPVPKAPLRKATVEIDDELSIASDSAADVDARDAARRRAQEKLKSHYLPGAIPSSSLYEHAELLGKSKMVAGLCPVTGYAFVACKLSQVRNNFSTMNQFLQVPGTDFAVVGYVSANFISQAKKEKGVTASAMAPRSIGNNIFYSVHRKEAEPATAIALNDVVAAADEVLTAAKLVVPPKKRGRPSKKATTLLQEAGVQLEDQRAAVNSLKQAAKSAARGSHSDTTLVFSWDPKGPLTLTNSGRATMVAKTQGFASLTTVTTENWGANLVVLGPRPSKEQQQAAKEERAKLEAEEAERQGVVLSSEATSTGTPTGFICNKALEFGLPLAARGRDATTPSVFRGGVDSKTGFAFITCLLSDVQNNMAFAEDGAESDFVAIPYAYCVVSGMVTHACYVGSAASLSGGLDVEATNATPKKIGHNLYFSTKGTGEEADPVRLIFSFHPKSTPKKSKSGKANVVAKTNHLASLSDTVAASMIVLKANSFMLHKLGVHANGSPSIKPSSVAVEQEGEANESTAGLLVEGHLQKTEKIFEI